MASKFMKALGLGAALAAGLALAPTAFAKDWKTVVIGMEGAYDPWNLTDSSGKIVGFEVDLAIDLCKRAGLECKIIAQDWDGMIPGLKAGKFDVIMDGMSITDERKKEIDFSKPYAASPGAFLAPKDSPLAKAPGAGTLVNLDKDAAAGDAAIKAVQAALKGKTLGVQVSTTHANFASQYLKDVADRQGIQDRPTTAISTSSPGASTRRSTTIRRSRRRATSPTPRISPSSGRSSSAACSAPGEAMGIRKTDADLTAKFDKALAEAIRRRVGQEIFRSSGSRST